MESDETSSDFLSDTSAGKLKELLRYESRSHRDTGQCYDTLQKEYDDLLRKYAEAENTIDKLRIDSLRDKNSSQEDEGIGKGENVDGPSDNIQVWKALYLDLESRTEKLQNDAYEFQAHLTNHEFAGEEVNKIFDGLNTDFEKVTNAFQSMQALGIKGGWSANEKYPEDAIHVDDLEGNLYRLGLRLEEIHDEIGDQIRSALKANEVGGNEMLFTNKSSESIKSPKAPEIVQEIDSDYQREGGATETDSQEENTESGDDNAEFNTEDLSQLIFYKKQCGNEFLGVLDPKYLSRSQSAPPHEFHAANAYNNTSTPDDHIKGFLSEQTDLSNLQNAARRVSTSSEESMVRERSQPSSRKSSNATTEHSNPRKSPSPKKSPIAQSKNPPEALSRKSPAAFSKDSLGDASSRPNVLNSTEDSGYIEGSQPSHHSFPSRFATSPLRNHSRINEVEASSFDPMKCGKNPEESAGEKYRQRLNSLRSYILAKRATMNSSSSAVDLTELSPRRWTRGKKTSGQNFRIPRLKLNTQPKVSSAYSNGSSSESIYSNPVQTTDDSSQILTADDEVAVELEDKTMTPPVQREEFESLREEMRSVRDIVLDLKNVLSSNGLTSNATRNSPSRIPVASPRQNESRNLHSSQTFPKNDATESYAQPAGGVTQANDLQNKQFEMLEKLDSKLEDISTKLQDQQNNSKNQENASMFVPRDGKKFPVSGVGKKLVSRDNSKLVSRDSSKLASRGYSRDNDKSSSPELSPRQTHMKTTSYDNMGVCNGSFANHEQRQDGCDEDDVDEDYESADDFEDTLTPTRLHSHEFQSRRVNGISSNRSKDEARVHANKGKDEARVHANKGKDEARLSPIIQSNVDGIEVRDSRERSPRDPRQNHYNLTSSEVGGTRQIRANRNAEEEETDPHCINHSSRLLDEPRHPHKMYSKKDYDGSKVRRQVFSNRTTDDLDTSFNIRGGGQHVSHTPHCSCNNCIARDNHKITRSNDSFTRDNDVNEMRARLPVHSRPLRNISRSHSLKLPSRSTAFFQNKHAVKEGVDSSFEEESEGFNRERDTKDLNDSVNTYTEKFDQIGEKIHELSSHMKEYNANEENRLRKLRAEKATNQKILVKTLEDKLEELTTKIEIKSAPELNSTSVTPAPMYVLSCPVCGGIGVHQHGAYMFNGRKMEALTGSPESPVTPNINQTQNGTAFRMHSTPTKNDTFEMQSSPKVHHHYHTIYSPQQQAQLANRSPKESPNEDHVTVPETRDLMIADRIQNSLERASMSALHMESLSKKMLRGIATDLFSTGPSEF